MKIKSLILSICWIAISVYLFSGSAYQGFVFIQDTNRPVDVSVSDTDVNGVVGIENEGSIQIGDSNEPLVTLTNNFNSTVRQRVLLDNSTDWNILGDKERTVMPSEKELYQVDASSVSPSKDSSSYKIRVLDDSLVFESERSVEFDKPNNILNVIPSIVSRESVHTWSLSGYTTPVVNGTNIEIDNITLDYSGTGTSFDGLSDENVTVVLTRQLSSGTDRSEIGVNSASYSGEKINIELSKFFERSVVDDSSNPNLVVEVNGVTNPSNNCTSNVCKPTIVLNKDTGNKDSLSGSLNLGKDPFFLPTIESIPSSVSGSQTINVDYSVNNTGFGSGTQDIEILVNSQIINTIQDKTLNENESFKDNFSYSDTQKNIELDLGVQTEDSTSIQTVEIIDRFILDLNNTSPESRSKHTWKASDIDYNGEVDTITVDYNSSFSFNGLDQSNITVLLTRQNEDSPTEINVNQDTYSGSSATFDLSGIFNTDIDGDFIIEINGIQNGKIGSYSPTIQLNGDDTFTDTADINISS